MNKRPPSHLLTQYNAYYEGDSCFRSWCRLKQSVYRKKKNWDEGPIYKDKARKLGNYLTALDANRGRNFLNESIFAAAKERMAKKSKGEVIQPDRLLRNMLTSQTLCFNLFLPQSADCSSGLKTATSIWTALYPERIRCVTAVKVEYSPRRSDPVNYTGDKSAFDAYIEYIHIDGGKGMIGIEVKYTDSFSGPKKIGESESDKASRKALDRVYNESKLYSERGWLACAQMRTEQLWRTHLLAESMRRPHEFQYVAYMVLHAKGDDECSRLLPEYRAALRSQDAIETVYLERTLEDFCVRAASALPVDEQKWICDFQERYFFDYEQLVREA